MLILTSCRVAHSFEKAKVESFGRLYVWELNALRFPLCYAHPDRTVGDAADTSLNDHPSTSPNRGAKHGALAQHPNANA